MADAESIACTQIIPYTQSDLRTALADSLALGADELLIHAHTLGYDPSTLSELQNVVVSTYGCLVRALPVWIRLVPVLQMLHTTLNGNCSAKKC
jgi:hypothetical protein